MTSEVLSWRFLFSSEVNTTVEFLVIFCTFFSISLDVFCLQHNLLIKWHCLLALSFNAGTYCIQTYYFDTKVLLRTTRYVIDLNLPIIYNTHFRWRGTYSATNADDALDSAELVLQRPQIIELMPTALKPKYSLTRELSEGSRCFRKPKTT